MKQGNISILFFTLIVVMLGFGMVIPILPFYIKSFNASGSALGLLMAAYGLMQFIFAPIWGQVSDRIGRKKVILLGVAGNALSQFLFAISSQLWMLFAARTLAGILSSATLPTSMAYISDSTTEEKRGGGMGIIGAAMGIGMVLGPGVGGVLAQKNLSLPFFIASALSIIAGGLIFVFLPESLPTEKRGSTGKIHGLQLSNIRKALLGPIGFLYFLAFMLSFALTNFESIFGLYAADRYSYTPQIVGYVLTAVGLTSAIAQGALTGPLTRRFGEAFIIRASLITSGFGFLLMTQARTILAVVAAAMLFIFCNSMLNPSNSSLISKRTTSGQGAAMGFNNAFLSLGRIAGPLWAGFVYDRGFNLPYVSGSIVLIVAFLLSLAYLERPIPQVAEPEPVK